MNTQDIVKLAAKAMGISEKNLKYCINEYPDGYFIWEPISRGKIMFLDLQGDYLVSGDHDFGKLYTRFKAGKRTNKIDIETFKEEIEEDFSV